ncbi:MAG: RagB/SusD family nutrient uptake outer membrane protein [Pedobacter sp.]|nr:MAG: RagB/SusD family nutrient uptake outer membrane protein [Pedobacter sp.]
MAYFYMVRIWGDVPLLVSSHDGEFVQRPRTDKNVVLQFVTNELLAAAQVVPFAYGGIDPIFPGVYYGQNAAFWNGALFNRLSVYAILAHVAAWQGNYLDANNYAKFVLDNRATYNLVKGSGQEIQFANIDALTENQSFFSPFAYKRPTNIVGFNFDAGSGLATADGHIEQLTLAAPYIPRSRPEMFVPKDTVLKAFTDPGDLRFSVNPRTNAYRTNYFTNFYSEEPVFSKIKVVFPDQIRGNTVLFASSMVFTRLEELVLLRAEALAALGSTDEAITLLNSLATNRGIAPYNPLVSGFGKLNVLKAIFAERRRELMGEGWRWYDIVRYNRIVNSNGSFISKNGQNLTFREFETTGGIYWPVSKDVISANPAIKQNPYWQ